MKTPLLLLFFALVSTPSVFAQAKRVYFAGSQIVIANSDGTNAIMRSPTQVNMGVSANNYISVNYNTYSLYLAPAEFLNSAGTAYSSVSPDAAFAAFLATSPTSGTTSGGSSGTVVASQSPATFGTAPTTVITYTGNSGTISTTNTIYMQFENLGPGNITLNYGGAAITMEPKEQRAFPARLDTTIIPNKYAAYPTMSLLVPSGTTAYLYKTPTQ